MTEDAGEELPESFTICTFVKSIHMDSFNSFFTVLDNQGNSWFSFNMLEFDLQNMRQMYSMLIRGKASDVTLHTIQSKVMDM